MTDLKISTMTIVSKLGMDINLRELYDKMEIDDDLICIEYGGEPRKGCSGKKEKKRRKTTTPKKSFYNQATLQYRVECKTNNKPVNMKIFNNGSCQLTGIPFESVAVDIIKKTKELIIKYNVVENKEYEVSPIKVCLINSGFSVGKIIDRDELFDKLLDEYDFNVNYEPGIYPGINLKYFWNEQTQGDSEHCGRCMCENYCEGNGCGTGNGFCRRISIMIFQSGQIIITGYCNIEQIQYIRNYLLKIL